MASGFFSSSSKGRSISNSLVKGAASRDSLFRRATFFMVVVTLLLSGCVLRLVQLQIVQGGYNKQLAEQNRIRPIPLPAPRGSILDRHGKLLASNQLSRGIYLWPRQQTPTQWKGSADRLSSILGIPAAEIIQRIEKVGYNSLMPVALSQNITPTMWVALAEQENNLPGIEVFSGSTRSYPHKTLAAHVIGYIGEATAEDMKQNPTYPVGMIVGLTGVERIANKELEGKWGRRLVEVDAGGKETRLLGVLSPDGGTDAKLTLDLDMQLAAEKALNGRRGAVVALDVNTGGVLVLASSPTYDPGIFTRNVTTKEWQKYTSGDQPFLNRALQGYPPGSTFKVVTSVAAMQSGMYKPNSTIMTAANINLGGHLFWEHSNAGYGVIGFPEALTVSSNTFFYQIGLKIGPEQIAKWGKVLGIGSSAELGLSGATPGMIPTPAEKEKLFGQPWYGGDTVSTAIGQGLVQATPLELATMVAVIANGGWRVHPHLLGSQDNEAKYKREPTGIDPKNLEPIRAGLVGAVREGTARRLNDGTIPLTAGKTGTAEVVGQQSHALFVGYGPVDKPQMAIAVVVENGGYGGVAAVPVAHEVYKAFFNQRKTPQQKAVPQKPKN